MISISGGIICTIIAAIEKDIVILNPRCATLSCIIISNSDRATLEGSVEDEKRPWMRPGENVRRIS